MVLDGLRGYVQIVNGLTDVARQRTLAVARSLMGQALMGPALMGQALMGPGASGSGAVLPADARDQAAAVTEELLETGKANRDLLLAMVRSEMERQVGRLGLVSADELKSATARADRLERRLRQLETERETARVASGAPSDEPAGAGSARDRQGTSGKAAREKGADASARRADAVANKTTAGARAEAAAKTAAAGVAGRKSATGGARPSVSRARSTRGRGPEETETT